MRIVVVWSVFAGPRRSTGVWSVLVVATLSPPSRTWRSISTISKTAEISIMRFIDKIKDPESVVKSRFFAIIFLQSRALYGNMTLWNKFCSSFCDISLLFKFIDLLRISAVRAIHSMWKVYFHLLDVCHEIVELIMLLSISSLWSHFWPLWWPLEQYSWWYSEDFRWFLDERIQNKQKKEKV